MTIHEALLGIVILGILALGSVRVVETQVELGRADRVVEDVRQVQNAMVAYHRANPHSSIDRWYGDACSKAGVCDVATHKTEADCKNAGAGWTAGTASKAACESSPVNGRWGTPTPACSVASHCSSPGVCSGGSVCSKAGFCSVPTLTTEADCHAAYPNPGLWTPITTKAVCEGAPHNATSVHTPAPKH